MKIRKKGQVEDFAADLIPSLIIIAIGLFILGNMQSVNKEAVDERGEKIKSALEQEEKILADYLLKKVKIDDKEIPLLELISLSYKNEKYWEKTKDELKAINGQPIRFRDWFFENVCLEAEIHYPDNSVKTIDVKCAGEKKTIALPTYEGGYLTINFVIGPAYGASTVVL